jgi:Leucine-rich repeat (LRR) protein
LFSNGNVPHCKFQRNTWTPFGRINECLIQNVEIGSRHDFLKQVKTFGNCDDDYESCSSESDDYDEEDDGYCYEVKSFYIYQSSLLRFIPSGITNYFRNLTVLVIAQTSLKIITKMDLKPFKNLKGLYLDKNELDVLESDLFEHNLKIQELNFSENLLKHIAFDVLEPLKHLTRADFFNNPCISFGASNKREIAILKKVFQDKFEPKPKKFQAESDEILES